MKLEIELKNPEVGTTNYEEERNIIKYGYDCLANIFMPNFMGGYKMWTPEYLDSCVEYLTEKIGDKFLIGRGGNHIWITMLNVLGKPVKDRSAIITPEYGI
jgi:hypothetical protein